ncbi:PIN domain-containing protein [Lysobacter xanthus]
MPKPYYLIDFENVQPKALDRLTPGAARIKVFLGQHQTRLMLDLVQALQPFGADAEYIAITGSGPDAVDFHIAYYIGRIAVEEPGAAFRIISKDKGFDPLVRHLNARGIACERLPEIPAGAGPVPAAVSTPKPVAKTTAKAAKKAVAKKKAAKNVVVTVEPARTAAPPAPTASTAARVKVVLGLLAKSTKPAKVSGLRSSIKSWFKPALDDKAVDAVLQSLESSKKIRIEGTKVTYAAL